MEALKIDPQDYVQLTSFTHHPFYQSFVLEIPDNWTASQVYNIPLEELQMVIDSSLEAGYAVNWAADVSEKGFAFDKGFAIVPVTEAEEVSGSDRARWTKLTDEELKKMAQSPVGPTPEKTITQQMRQDAFDNYETTGRSRHADCGISERSGGTSVLQGKKLLGRSAEPIKAISMLRHPTYCIKRPLFWSIRTRFPNPSGPSLDCNGVEPYRFLQPFVTAI